MYNVYDNLLLLCVYYDYKEDTDVRIIKAFSRGKLKGSYTQTYAANFLFVTTGDGSQQNGEQDGHLLKSIHFYKGMRYNFLITLS